MMQAEVAVIGGGPAGLCAALEASLAGAKVVLLDEYPRPGGQYFKQPPSTFKVLNLPLLGRDYDKGQALMRRIEQGQIEVLGETTVWAALEPGVLDIYRHGGCQRLQAQRIVVATGAYERPMAFPGWTLPGVMTAGAAQTLVKTQGVLPGSRILMVGSGPLQLAVATQLEKAGAAVVGVVDALRLVDWIRQGVRVWWRLDKLKEAREYFAALREGNVPTMFGWTIREARGKDGVEQAVITKVDESWRPVAGTEKTLDVDTICLAFGFLPSLQVPRLLGCRMRWDAKLAYWVTDHDADQRTSVAGVFVAGETAGIGGHAVAMAEGAIAGAKAGADLGYRLADETENRLAKVREELSHHRQFAGFLNRTFALRPGIYDIMKDDTLVCRCEEVTAGEVAAAAREWDGSLRTIKQLTRAGMGHCQGRMCWPLVAQIAARASGKTVEEIGLDSLRPPIKPVPLGAMAGMPTANSLPL